MACLIPTRSARPAPSVGGRRADRPSRAGFARATDPGGGPEGAVEAPFVEAAGAGASRIENQPAVPLLLLRLVTVTGNDRADPRRARVKTQLRHVVQHVQEHAPDLENLSGRKLLGPRAAIVVATNGRHRRDRAEPLQHVRRADVPGVDDRVDAPERYDRLRSQSPVSVGDDAHRSHARAAHAGANAGSHRALPLGSSATRSGASRTRWPILSAAGSASTRAVKTRWTSTFTIAKTRGPSKPAGSPASCSVKAWSVPSPGRSTHSNRSDAHSPQKPRGGHAVVRQSRQRVVMSRPDARRV